eukprot:621718-Rhodomonas_salina.1
MTVGAGKLVEISLVSDTGSERRGFVALFNAPDYSVATCGQASVAQQVGELSAEAGEGVCSWVVPATPGAELSVMVMDGCAACFVTVANCLNPACSVLGESQTIGNTAVAKLVAGADGVSVSVEGHNGLRILHTTSTMHECTVSAQVDVTDEWGVITDGPGNYPGTTACVWRVQPASGAGVVLDVIDMYLEDVWDVLSLAACTSGEVLLESENNACLDPAANNCHAEAACSVAETEAGYECACNSGWSGDGVVCENENECTAATDDCSTLAICSDTLGSFLCACNAGWTSTDGGVNCVDEDECAAGTHACDASAQLECSNTPAGSYSCVCSSGWTGDG